QENAYVTFGIDAVEPVGHHLPRGPMQFCSEFRARRASADDGDVKLTRTLRLRLGMGADERVHQTAVEARGLLGRFERNGEFGDARRSEIIGDAADRDDESVVMEAPRRRDLAALFVIGRGDLHLLLLAIEADQLPEPVAEMPPMRLGEVIELVLAG